MKYTPGDLLKRRLVGYECIVYMVVNVHNYDHQAHIALIHFSPSPTVCNKAWTTEEAIDREFEHSGINLKLDHILNWDNLK